MDSLRKEPTIEIYVGNLGQRRIKNPFIMMSDEQMTKFLSGFTLDYVTYTPDVVLRAEEFNLNYKANYLIVNFLNPNTSRWVQVSRKRADVDDIVFQKLWAELSKELRGN